MITLLQRLLEKDEFSHWQICKPTQKLSRISFQFAKISSKQFHSNYSSFHNQGKRKSNSRLNFLIIITKLNIHLCLIISMTIFTWNFLDDFNIFRYDYMPYNNIKSTWKNFLRDGGHGIEKKFLWHFWEARKEKFFFL